MPKRQITVPAIILIKFTKSKSDFRSSGIKVINLIANLFVYTVAVANKQIDIAVPNDIAKTDSKPEK